MDKAKANFPVMIYEISMVSKVPIMRQLMDFNSDLDQRSLFFLAFFLAAAIYIWSTSIVKI
jgi:hypothetical protein